jgi:SAM-dependent methyltransferase
MTTWPKQIPALTEEQARIREDFIKYWHEVLPRNYGAIERFNHVYPTRNLPQSDGAYRVLEIGAGLGEHIGYEDLRGVEYYALELREEMAAEIRQRFPHVETIVGDIQKPLNFPPHYFHRVVAIHVLEHLPNLRAALEEVHRILHPAGRFDVVIPCEGGMAYTLARRISAQRLFVKRYKMEYEWFVRSEHINVPAEILEELSLYFSKEESRYFPFLVPSVQMNLVIGIRLSSLAVPGSRNGQR